MQGQIAEYLRLDILSGRLEPGQALREQEISERFGVSRGPVREVFRQLTQQGLLVSEPNKGVRVAQRPSPTMRPLIAEIRQSIELYVLDRIFDQLNEEDIVELESILADIKEACQKGDKVALIEHDLRFHETIIHNHKNDDYFTLWQPIALRMSIHYSRFGDDLMDSYYEHERILNAIRSGNKAGAMEALKANIQ
jgi:DNA-binding GntR family transcriptional regulator